MFHKHGGDIYACLSGRQPDGADGQAYTYRSHNEIKDFSANINFRGMPDTVRQAAERAVADSVHYPDPECRALRMALARRETALLAEQDAFRGTELRRLDEDDCDLMPVTEDGRDFEADFVPVEGDRRSSAPDADDGQGVMPEKWEGRNAAPDSFAGQIRPRQVICGAEKDSRSLQSGERICPSQVICGNGAAELMFALAAACRPKKALLAIPSFFEYEQALTSFGCEIQHFKLQAEQDYRFGADFLDAVETAGKEAGCIVLGNPNNPTGQLIDGMLLERLIQRCRERKVLLVLDESFYDFLCGKDRRRTFSGIREVLKYPGLFVLRSFTKIYGMPGLRFGYGISSDSELLERMREVVQPWNVSVPAQAAALQAAGELAFARETARLNQENRAQMSHWMEEAGYRVFPSDANFVLFEGPEHLKAFCLERGFLIRDCSNFPGLGKGFFRICIRSSAENAALMHVLAEAKTELQDKQGRGCAPLA